MDIELSNFGGNFLMTRNDSIGNFLLVLLGVGNLCRKLGVSGEFMNILLAFG
jgi:hypothetical protein